MTKYRSGKQLTQKQHNQPTCSFLHQMPDRNIKIRLIQSLRTSEALHVLRILFICHPKDIIYRHNTQHESLHVNYGKRHTNLHPKHRKGIFLRVVSIKRYQTVINKLAYQRIWRCQQNIFDSNVVDKPSVGVDDVQHIDGFRSTPVTAYMFQHTMYGPMFFYGDIVRRHQTSHTVFRIPKQRKSFLTLFGSKQRNQTFYNIPLQLPEERSTVVRRHGI